MSISITIDNDRTSDNGVQDLIEDESLGTQTPLGTATPASTDTGNEIDVTLSNPVGGTLGGFLPTFNDFLNNVGNIFSNTFQRSLADAQRVFAAANDGASSAADFVKVTVTNGETISDLFFSDSAGAALNGDAATGVFTTVDNLQVYLWSAGDYCIATTSSVSASAGRIVAAFYLADTDPNHLQAQVQMVTFEALKHTGTTNPDDAINFSNVLQVSAAGSQSFNFDALHSSGGIWVAVGNNATAILVSGYSLDVDNKGKIEPTSNKIAVSQGGTGTTIGVNNQLFDNVGEKAVFTLVSGLDVFTSADSGILSDYVIDQNKPGAEGINYSGFINVVGAGIFVSQSQGNDPKDFGIDLTHAGGVNNTPEIGLNYIGTEPSGAFQDDSPVNVATVTVKAADGHILGTWVLGADPDGAGPLQANGATVSYGGATVQVTISANHIDINGVLNDYTVSWTCAAGSTFNRFVLTDDGTGKFDVGRVDLLQGVSAHTPVGGNLVVQDDGPTVGATPSTTFVQHDESAGVQFGLLNGNTDADDKDVAGSAFITGSSGPTVASLFAGVTSTGDPDVTPKDTGNSIGFARSGGSLLTVTGSYGTDGAGSVSYALSVVDGTFSGVETTGGTRIFLYNGSGTTAGLILGRVGNEVSGGTDTPNSGGAIAFALAVGSTTGEGFIAQYLSLSHPTGGSSYDETISLLAAAVQMSATRVDGDGDSVADSDNNVGNLFKFDDDGPTVTATATANFVQHDETAGVQNGGGDADDKDVAGSSFITGTSGPTVDSLFAGVTSSGDPDVTPKDTGNSIGFARSGGSLLTAGGSYGSDGAGSVSYALSVSDGTYSGVETTGGTRIFLYNGSGTTAGLILGRVGNEVSGGTDTPNSSGAIAFALAVGSSTGEGFIAQYLSLNHPTGGSSYDETISLLTAAVQMSATRTDGDGDSTSASDNVGNLFKFDDDGPTVAATPSTNFVQHDETAGVQNGGADAADKDVAGSSFITGSSGPTVDSLFAGVISSGDPDVTPKDTGNSIGFARSGGSLLTTPTGSFGSDGAGSVPLSYALSVSDGTFSGVETTGGTRIFLYNGSGTTAGLILGRVGNEVAGGTDTPNSGGAIAFALAVGSTTGEAFIAQYLSLNHPTGGSSYDETITLLAGAVQMSVTRTDGDGDTITDGDNNVGDLFKFDDDGPNASGTAVTGNVDEDGAIVVTGNPGGLGDDLTSSRTATGSIAGIFGGGSDGVLRYQLATDTSGLPSTLTSKGGNVVYNVNTATQTLTGYVELGGTGFDPAVDRTVFTLALSGANNGTYTFTLVDQLDHAAPPAGTAFENEITLNLGSVLQVVDGDGDTATATADKLVITADDDSPTITAQIVSGIVDFTSGKFVTSSLNGSVGFDENNASNQSAAGTKTYTFTSYTGDADSPFSANTLSLFPGIHAVLSADGTTVNYYSTAGTGSPLYQIVLGDQGAAGSYTFTAQQNAPNLSFDFDFGNLPSNQNLFGLIAANESNIDTKGTPNDLTDDTLPDGGILVIAQGVNLKADNSYSNTSQTINTSAASQISGATIGVSNQAFEGGTFNPGGADTRGDAAYFVYVDNPYRSSTSGLPVPGGLTSTTADDADSIKFSGLLEVRTASVTMVQAQLQGNPFVGMKIEAFHHTNEGLALDDNPTTENRDFALNPVAGTTVVPITSVRVYQIDQNTVDNTTQSGFKETLVEQWDYLSDADPLHHTVDSASTGVVATAFNGVISNQGLSFVDLTGMQNNMRIEFDTKTVHDTALITNIQGAFDLGAYSISQTTLVPDQVFDYSVQVTDYDQDVFPGAVSTTVDDFSVTVNGSGTFNLTGISGSDIDTVPTQLTRVISGFTSGTDKLDFASVSGSFTAESGTHAANLASFIGAADANLNGTVDFYFDTFGGNGYLAYDNNGTGITAVIELVGVTSMTATDLV
jgi:hypothetical protein